MCLDDVVDDGKSEAGPGGFGSIIWIENVRNIFRIDAGAGIRYPDKKRLMVHGRIRGYLEGAAGFHGLNSVEIEIEKDLVDTVRVEESLKGPGRNIAFYRNVPVRCLFFNQLQGIIDERKDGGPLFYDLDRAGKFQQLTDNPVQLVDLLDHDPRDLLIFGEYPDTFP